MSQALQSPIHVWGGRTALSHRIVVADANALYQDVVTRSKRDFTMLTDLAAHDAITILTSKHVLAHAVERLPQIARDTRTDARLVLRTWREVHSRLTRFVEVPASMCGDDPRVTAIGDVEDRPFAQLAIAAGPSLLLTRDRHFHDAGVGTEHWVDALKLLGGLIEHDVRLEASAKALLAVGYPAVLLAREALRALASSPVASGLVLGAATALLVSDPVGVGARVRAGREAAGRAGDRLLEASTPFLERRERLGRELQAQLVRAQDPRPIDSICARHLATQRDPSTLSSLAMAVRSAGHRIPDADLSAYLHAHPSFSVDEHERWSLGRRAPALRPSIAGALGPARSVD